LELACFAPAFVARFDPAGMSYRLRATITTSEHDWAGPSLPPGGLEKISDTESRGFQGFSATDAQRGAPQQAVWHRLCIRGKPFATKSRERAAAMAAFPSPGTGRATRADAGSKSDKRLSPSRGLADLFPAVGTSHSFPHSTPAIPVTPPPPGGWLLFMNAERRTWSAEQKTRKSNWVKYIGIPRMAFLWEI
jgi:hypothetical protein